MIADGIFNISKMVELLCTDFMNIDFTLELLLCVGDR